MNILKPLQGFDSEEKAYLVNDYPYGFRLRTQIRYWIETKKGFGQRFCSQTRNPKFPGGEIWNKPKNGIYHTVIGMGLDEKNYVTYTTLSSGGWSKEEQIQEFEKMFSPLTEYQTKAIAYIRQTNKLNTEVEQAITSDELTKRIETGLK